MFKLVAPKSKDKFFPNFWDLLVVIIIFGIIAILSWVAIQSAEVFTPENNNQIDLSYQAIFGYSLRTIARMIVAIILSLAFSFIVAPLAAKNKEIEKFIIPFIDIMESIPVLGFLSVSVMFFLKLFPNSMLGPEAAAIFAIFTSQVWNITLALYQSIKTTPAEYLEAAKVFQLNAWQKFWRIELPYAMPALVWNTMISMSAGWFFVVASEAITVSNQQILLPGLGSYIHTAILNENTQALGMAILSMLIIILSYDQLIFRSVISWSGKFKSDYNAKDDEDESWFYNLLVRSPLLQKITEAVRKITRFIINDIKIPKKIAPKFKISNNIICYIRKLTKIIWNLLLLLSLVLFSYILITFINKNIDIKEIFYVLGLGVLTGIKILVLVVIASLVWLPLGVWIGLNPKITRFAQPLAQFMAAFPANFFYPIFAIAIYKFNLNANIWTSPLMILGTQWYILFSIIAGASSIPKDIRYATASLGLKGSLKWRKFIFPAVFPYYITGAMAAAGGCWNASIVAEIIKWGDTTIIVKGIGSYIEQQTVAGDFPRIALGLAIMSFYVIAINRLVWHKLYTLAETRFKLES